MKINRGKYIETFCGIITKGTTLKDDQIRICQISHMATKTISQLSSTTKQSGKQPSHVCNYNLIYCNF